ncbi:MAG: Amidase, partial [Nevskia sp.]|nr:Amidase [Nevskia sp.]
MNEVTESRRRFIASFAAMGLSTTLLPGILWAKMEQAGTPLTSAMLKDAAALAGLEFSDAELGEMLKGVNQNLQRYEAMQAIHIPNDTAPPFYFSPITAGMKVDRSAQPLRFSTPKDVKRPADLEQLAFWPVAALAQLLKTRAVTSVELTQMYLARLKKHNGKINCVVSFLDDLAMSQAKQADAEIAAGHYKGPLHGMPWGAKDIIAVKGYKTTWG